jgi:tetratricopeptide (TPR) repeat protein
MTSVLVKMGSVTEDGVREAMQFFGEERIYDLFALDQARFEFVEGDPDPEYFDADQRAVALALDTNKVLFEAARRTDEWQLIRRKILSNEETFSVPPEKRDAVDALEDRGLKSIARLCDGTRTINEVISDSAEGAFTVCKAITDLLGKGLVRPIATDELDTLAEQARRDGDLAACIRYSRQALEHERNRPATRERLAQALAATGDPEGAATEWKLLATAATAAEDTELAVRAYREAIECRPSETSVREQLVQMLADAGRPAEAIAAGRDLALAYRELALPEKVRDTYVRLLELVPDDADLPRLLADAHVELGDTGAAYHVLMEQARRRAEGGREADAVPLLKALLKLQPSHAEARRLLTDIESGNLEKKLAKRARRKRTLATLAIAAALVGYGVYDLSARIAGEQAAAAARDEYIKGNRGAAIQVCRDTAARWPLTRAAWLLTRQAADYDGQMDLGLQLQALLKEQDLAAATGALQENRRAVLEGVQGHESRLAVEILPRFEAIAAGGPSGDALAVDLIAEAGVLGVYPAAYEAIVRVLAAEIEQAGDTPPADPARWRGMSEAAIALRPHCGLEPARNQFAFGGGGAQPGEILRKFSRAWIAERDRLLGK